jgi:hypothetical protein
VLLYRNQTGWQYSAKVLTIPPVRKKFTVAKTSRIGYTLSIKSRKRENMTEFEKQCYGMSTADIREQYMQSITARYSGLEMVCMSILSDAQELQSFNHAQALDQSRKLMNIAKYILSEMLEEKSTQVA